MDQNFGLFWQQPAIGKLATLFYLQKIAKKAKVPNFSYIPYYLFYSQKQPVSCCFMYKLSYLLKYKFMSWMNNFQNFKTNFFTNPVKFVRVGQTHKPRAFKSDHWELAWIPLESLKGIKHGFWIWTSKNIKVAFILATLTLKAVKRCDKTIEIYDQN